MFNTFFKGSIDDLLNTITTAPQREIEAIGNENQMLNREEIIAFIIDDMKCSREKAEEIATEIQLEEFHRIAKEMVEEGTLEIISYDEEGNPQYQVTEKGKEMRKL